jgi:hypothetical protein
MLLTPKCIAGDRDRKGRKRVQAVGFLMCSGLDGYGHRFEVRVQEKRFEKRQSVQNMN